MTTPYYKIWPFELTAARNEKLRITAGLIVFVEAVNALGVFQPGAVLQISLSDRDQDFVPFYPGSRLVNKTSDQVRIKWDAQAGITARLLIGEPDVLDLVSVPRTTLVVGEVGATLTTTGDISLPATAVTTLLAASGVRRKAYINNPIASPREIRVGDNANVGAARGLLVAPGESVEIETSAEISAFNPHSVAFSVNVLEVDE